MKELVRYLLENMYLDFQGEISLDTVRQFLRTDDSREARQLLQKLIEDKGVDELLLTLADCLKDHLRSGVNEEVVREQLALYSELIAAVALAGLLCGCDQGSQRDEPAGVQLPIASIHLLGANVGPTQPLPANGRIELQFDRLLQPLSITRQTFVLENIGGTVGYTPQIAYDPVARIVTITPLPDASQSLEPGQSYQVVITTPKNAGDPNGLRAIDGATLDAPATRQIAFMVTPPTASPPPTVTIDFCRDIAGIIENKCSLQQCHGPAVNPPNRPGEGLLLNPFSGIAMTAVGRVSQEANTGPRALAQPPALLFGEDMPIIDPTGNPGNSWMMYKMLLAIPAAGEVASEPDAGSADATVAEAGAETEGGADASIEAGRDGGLAEGGARDGGVAEGGADAGVAEGGAGEGGAEEGGTTPPMAMPQPVDVRHVHSLAWHDMGPAERAVLNQYILGREMPYPALNPKNVDPITGPLTLDELQRMSLWMAQGAPAPAECR